ncbi:MAG: hypothetical protein QM673_05105 [Gordonia sp. (in: high G+C Gram-positive bacteria)]
MDEFLRFAGDYWWLIFPVGGIVGGWARSVSRYSEKRRRDKIELARVKAAAQTERLQLVQADKAAVAKALARHDSIDERWVGYELDLATLIEYPMMIDMREPLTLAFHRAKVRADDLRPASAQEKLDPVEFDRYREAVGDYAAAFDAAEREARRRKHAGFSPVERERLNRARKLIGITADAAATAAERQAAYRKARRELDGLIDIPRAAAAQIEGRIAGQLEPRRDA